MRDEEDEAWRAIVDNYGERPELTDPAPEPEHADAEVLEPDAVIEPEARTAGDDTDPFLDDFVQPDPALPPLPPPDRAAAWAGVFGSPLALLVAAILRVDLPDLLAFGLVAAFVGGFVYLVATMTREPRDPFDDGAQI